MTTKAMRQKLIVDFGKLLEDDSKLNVLEGIFDALNKESKDSMVSDDHYIKVAESRAQYLSNSETAMSWDDFEKELIKKYDL
ncbi:hypothetical protein [Flavobacterium sp.]|uniref:hypothetical protein n=1 Tax=Flavobacterium sp. TaxID=239 RepID=UPI00391C786E